MLGISGLGVFDLLFNHSPAHSHLFVLTQMGASVDVFPGPTFKVSSGYNFDAHT